MDQILQTLLTMTTTASVAALCVMGLRLLLKRAPRWITCLLWMVVFVRMVCPVSFSLPVSLVPAPIAQGTYVQQAGQALEASSRAQAPAPADTGGPADQGASAGADRTDVVVGLWGAGTLGMFLWGGVSYLRLRRRTGEAIRLEGNLYETDQIAAPFVCGVFSPKIYLPVRLDPQDRPYVLLHEQAHLRRRDHLTKPLAWLALCLHWCNPLLWLAYRLFCRDLETACDQAVIRRFGAKDTAQYAAALLHLGHSGKLPQAVPLAFGEEDPKGRIRHVLDYKRPPVWVAGIALLVCAATIVLILANPGVPEDQMEGVAITETYLQLRGTPVRLPEELQTSLVSLLRDYDQEDYTPLAQFSLPNGALLLTNANRGTQFCLFLGETGAPVLVRLNHDGYSASQKKAVLPESLLQDPRWRAFQTSLSSYLREGWAEDLYALKTPYLGSPSACLAILEELHLSQAVGPYQIALQTERAPYGITLQFQEACPQGALSSATEYLRFCGTVFQALVGNGDRFSWELPLEGSDTPVRGTVEKTPWDTTSLTAFLPAWQQALEPLLQESPLSQTTQPE
ncbi:M56 family metallopeptidase [Evtepia gabavorous]|uniref:M56 family metallopeptidase n=1 Tax=Evtepia gabavorous TaxID=2211183 RepID=UPI003AB13CEA